MICKRNKDNRYFNYEFRTFDKTECVELWNPYRSSETTIISYEKWLNDYTIIDKWKTIKITT